MARNRPSIKSPCNADQYHAQGERIAEFYSRHHNGGGGLVSVQDVEQGLLKVEVYRCDTNVRVYVDPASIGNIEEVRAYLANHPAPQESVK